MHTLKSISETNNNYNKAFERLRKRGFEHFVLAGSGYSHYVGNDFESREGDISEADEVSINISCLMEYGKPVLIEKSYWTYRDSFVRIDFYAYETIELVFFDEYEKIYKSDTLTIKIKFGSKNFGIGNWKNENIDELLEITKECKQNVKEKLLKGINRANESLREWREAKKKIYAEEL